MVSSKPLDSGTRNLQMHWFNLDLPKPFSLCIIHKKVQTELVVVLVYVNDLLVTGSSPNLILQTRNDLKFKFNMKDLGELKFFLE